MMVNIPEAFYMFTLKAITKMGDDSLQPKTVSNGYFAQAEQLKDFIDYLFDIKKIGNYNELWNEFLEWDEEEDSIKKIK